MLLAAISYPKTQLIFNHMWFFTSQVNIYQDFIISRENLSTKAFNFEDDLYTKNGQLAGFLRSTLVLGQIYKFKNANIDNVWFDP